MRHHFLIRKMLRFLPLATAITVYANVECSEAAPRVVESKAVPAEAKTVAGFAPRGWRVERRVNGDLNRDKIGDAVIQLIEGGPAEDGSGRLIERQRALVIVFGKEGGTYRRAAVAPRLLQCSTCGGMLGDVSLMIKNGVLIVRQLSGSREARDLTRRFRYDGKARRFMLIGEDVEEYDRLTGEGRSESRNYLTGRMIVRQTRVRKAGGNPVNAAKREVKIPGSKRFIEDIDYATALK